MGISRRFLWPLFLLPFALAAETNPPEFSIPDRHADEATTLDERSLASLATFLAQGMPTEKEKARAAFHWIALHVTYDKDTTRAHNAYAQSAEGVLKNRVAVCEGFTQIFNDLVTRMGIKSERYGGWSGNSELAKNADHAWSAIYLESKWQLVDMTFGDFLTPPEEFRLNHFPDEARMQLVEPPMTKEEWANSVKPQHAFFANGFKLNLLSDKQLVLRTNAIKTLTLTGPPDVSLGADLYEILPRGETKIWTGAFVTRRGPVYEVSFWAPHGGSYWLKIFSNPNWLVWYRVEAEDPIEPWHSFPQQFGSFVKMGGEIISPMSNLLKRGAQVDFAYRLPGVSKARMNISTGSDWDSRTLQKRVSFNASTDGILRTQVHLPEEPGWVEIMDDMNLILIYQVQ